MPSHRHLTALPDPSNPPTPSDRPTAEKESYADAQARLDAEAVDRWAVIVADLPPLTDDQIRALALILNQIDAHPAQDRDAA